jgi:hypothetical protein
MTVFYLITDGAATGPKPIFTPLSGFVAGLIVL